MKRVVWTDPVPTTEVRCRHCRKPLEAYGEIVYKSRPHPEYLWRHIGGAEKCTTTNRAMPSAYLGSNTLGMYVKAALAGRRAAEAALNEALDDGGRSRDS